MGPGESSEIAATEVLNAPPSLGVWTRIYLHGCIAFVVVFALAYVVGQLVPYFDFFGNPTLAAVLAIVTTLVAPPLAGSIVLFGVLPLLGRREAWRGRLAWDDHLFSELSRAKSRARIVIVHWPDAEVRTIGVLTSKFASPDGTTDLAAVYIPTAPQTRLGYIRVIDLNQVEFTDWTLREWQLYQFTFGSVVPARDRPT